MALQDYLSRLNSSQWARWQPLDVAYVAFVFVLYPFVIRIPPFERQFLVNDVTLLHPFAEHERVPVMALFLFSTWIPLAVAAAVGAFFARPGNKLYVAYISGLGLLISVFTASTLTDLLKNAFGRHRPDFLARCVPRSDAPLDTMVFAKDVCTTKALDVLADGFRTTPLGHSSISFAGLLYLSLHLAAQLGVTRPRTSVVAWVVCALPTVGAAFIALSRTEDYRHHFVDVFVGSCLGCVIGAWLYFRLFPRLNSVECSEPRSIELEEYLPV